MRMTFGNQIPPRPLFLGLKNAGGGAKGASKMKRNGILSFNDLSRMGDKGKRALDMLMMLMTIGIA